MRLTIRKIFNNQVPPDFVYLSRNFAIVVAVFGLNFLYLCAYGHYYQIICELYMRWIVKTSILVIFYYTVVLSILLLYKRISQKDEDAEQKQQPTTAENYLLQEDEE